MAKCKYYLDLNGRYVTLDGDKELVDYVKTNLTEEAQPKFKVKYSLNATDAQNSTIEALKRVSTYNDPVGDSNPYAFLKRSHDGAKSKDGLLVLQFNSEEYKVKLREEIEAELKGASKELIDTELKVRLATNAFMEELSISFKKIFKNRFNDYAKKYVKNTEAEIKETVIRILKFNAVLQGITPNYTEENIDAFTQQILETIDSKISYLKDLNGILKVSQNISVREDSINKQVSMSAIADIMNIDKQGVPHLFEIKISERPYEKWDSEKKKHTDYLLGIKRQLLANFVDTSSTTLNILNIVIPKLPNGTLNINGITIRSDIERTMPRRGQSLNSEAVSILNYDKGTATLLLRKLLPASLPEIKKTSTTLVKDTSDLLNTIFPTYKFRSKIETTAESMYKNALKRGANSSEVFFYDRTTSPNEKITVSKNNPNWEQEFKDKVEEYVKRWNADKDSKVLTIVQELINSKNAGGKFWNSRLNGTHGVIEKTLSKYLDNNWEILNKNIPELNELGILLFHNTQTNTIEAISITANPLYLVHNLGFGTSLLGKFKTDNQVQNKGVLKANGTNIETIKVLAALNNLKDILIGKSIGNISVINLDPDNDKGDFVALGMAINNFNMIMEEVGKKLKETNVVMPIDNFRNKNIKVVDTFLDLYNRITLNPFVSNSLVRTWDLEKAKDIIKGFELGEELPKDAYDKLQWFVQVRDAMTDPENGLHKKLLEYDQRKVPDFDDPLQYIYYLVTAGINYYEDLINIFDADSPKYGISTGDATHYFRTLIFGSAPEYDERGNKIVGILQGSQFNTTDAMQSIALTKLHDLVAIAHDQITSAFQKEHVAITRSTEKYYEAAGRSDWQRMLIGGADKYHKIFFETDNGEVTSEFRFKNPWDSNANLENHQREYLKNILFVLFKNSNLNNTNIETLEQLEKSQSFEAIKDGTSPLFLAPLIKKTGADRWIPTNGDFKKFIGRSWDSVRDILDPQARTEEERVRSYNKINAFRKVHNQYDLGNDTDFRNEMIEKYSPAHFEINIDTIASKYVLEHLREKYLNAVMLDINAGLTVLKFHAWQTGNIPELEKALNDFWDQLKISVYHTSIIEGEGQDAIALMKRARQLTSFMTIALRPLLMAKELTVGLYKNVAYSYFKVYGDESFGEEELMFGYSKVLAPTQESYMLNGALNMEYRIANMDLYQLTSRKKYDRFGLNFLSENFYWFSTAPDYVNRLSVFFAKMKKDGCYDAHHINEEGALVYDATKDKRYSYYLANRSKYKVNDKYTFSKNDIQYNKERSIYLSVLEEFNAERLKVKLPALTEEDLLPKAYSTLEKQSIKTFIDTVYGYYDQTTTPLIFNKVAGIMFGQFLRYYPAKFKFYLGKPVEHSTKGYRGQKYTIQDDGTKVMLWRKEEFDENGLPTISEIPESELKVDDIRVPAMGWIGAPSEGIMYSLAYTMHDIINGKLDKTATWRVNQAKLALNDLLMSFIFLWLGSILFLDKKAFKEMTLAEQNVMKVGFKSINELNIFVSLFGQVQATPAFLKILGGVKDDVLTFLSGDLEISKLIKNNIRMLELLPMGPTPMR